MRITAAQCLAFHGINPRPSLILVATQKGSTTHDQAI